MKQLIHPETISVVGPWTDGLREVNNPYEARATEIIGARRLEWFNGYLVKPRGLKILNYDQQILDVATTTNPVMVDFLFRWNIEGGATDGINNNGKETLIGADTVVNGG